MNIAIVLDNFSIGGIETVAKNYINLLHERGHIIDVYVMHPKETEMKTMIPSDVEVIPVNFSRYLCPELYSYGVMNWWWGKYAYPPIHFFLTILLKVRKLFFKKKHYDIAIAFSGHIGDLTFVTEGFVCAKQKMCWCHGSLLSYLAICDAYPVLYKKIDKIVTLSEQELFSVYAGHGFLYSKQIKNIYNPVLIKNEALNEDHVRQLKEKYGDFVLMIARATSQKDHLTAIKAIEYIKKYGLNKTIVFLGDGEKLEEYKQYVHEHHLDTNCVFEGARRDVCDYIAASYINVLASRFEGLPTVIIEAMAYGKPCIMTNSDGGEVSGFGKYCVLTRLGDYEAIGKALIEFYEKPNVYEKYQKLSELRYKDFDPDQIINELEQFLN